MLVGYVSELGYECWLELMRNRSSIKLKSLQFRSWIVFFVIQLNMLIKFEQLDG